MSGTILAIVTVHADEVAGGAPIFRAADSEAQMRLSFLLEKILDGAAHDLQNGTMIIVKHG